MPEEKEKAKFDIVEEIITHLEIEEKDKNNWRKALWHVAKKYLTTINEKLEVLQEIQDG